MIGSRVKFLFFIFSFFFFINSYCQQEIEFFGEGRITGIISSENEIPFWMYKNSSTRIGEFTNGAAYGKVGSKYNFGNSNSLEGGVSLMFRDGVETKFQRENLFLEYKNNWLKATLGAKERPILYKGLSSTNGNMIWSNNARPLPGLILEANQPIRISNTFAIDWGIAHYSLNDDRYVNDTRVHYKRLGLIVSFNEKNRLTARLQHFAQWAGTSPEHGELPNDFNAFIDVFFARGANDDAPQGEIINATGNHLGSFWLDYFMNFDFGDFKVYHEHPFDDGSGTGLSNFPDGVWGISFNPLNKKIFSNILYEYIDTTNQSGSSGVSGRDNYFNNSVYESGWTYEGNIIGTPIFISDGTNNIPIISNRVQAHHIGIMGAFENIDWVFKSTYSTSYGTYKDPFSQDLERWFNYVSFSYKTIKYGSFGITGGIDTSNMLDTIIGGGLFYAYTF